MASVLIIGKTCIFGDEELERLASDNIVVVAGQDVRYKGKLRGIHTYNILPTDENFSQLFNAYTFDAVWYVSGYVDFCDGVFGEEELLGCALNVSAESRVGKFIFLSSVCSRNCMIGNNAAEAGSGRYLDTVSFRISQLESLALFEAEKTGMKVVTVRLPYVAGRVNDTNFLGGVFHRAVKGEKVVFPYDREDRIDFISLQDLSDLLIQITEETDDDTAFYTAVSGYIHTYGDFEKFLLDIFPDAKVEYKNAACDILWPDYPTELRRRYGFIPMDDVSGLLREYYEVFVKEVEAATGGRIRRILKKLSSGIFKYVELVLLFILTEFIAQYTSDSVYFKFADIRLAYIIIMGTVHGMKMGIISALLEGGVLVTKYIDLGMSGTLLFYNIENWIPFVIYLMAGSIPGYVRDKAAEDLSFAKNEYELLRNKYMFLSSAYYGALQNKGEFKRQILGFKDSFGKIFEAVQKLDDELPQSIFLDGLEVLEDILENRSVAIYTVDSYQRFGRLVTCSGNLLSRLAVSIRLAEYQEMYRTVKAGKVYKNIGLEPDMPMYACGVLQSGEVVLLVVLWDAGSDQYGTHYTNIFQILCGLVQTSFLRALEYEELRYSQLVVPGTKVMVPKHFNQIITVQEELRQKGAAEYMLLQFEERDPVRLSEMLSGIIRASDSLGQGGDGRLYLLLTQVTDRNFDIVGQRLGQREIRYEIVEKVGES